LRQPQSSFSWWRTQNAPIRAGFVLPFKEAQCFAPGWFYTGEMFDLFLETRPPILFRLALHRRHCRILHRQPASGSMSVGRHGAMNPGREGTLQHVD